MILTSFDAEFNFESNTDRIDSESGKGKLLQFFKKNQSLMGFMCPINPFENSTIRFNRKFCIQQRYPSESNQEIVEYNASCPYVTMQLFQLSEARLNLSAIVV